MRYLLGFEFLLLFALILAKLRTFPRLSEQKKSFLLERWSTNFSFEIINRLMSLVIGSIVIDHVYFRKDGSENWQFFLCYIVILDFVFYWRHRFYHRWLWSVHRTHHSDLGYDFSLSLRIHPMETLIHIGLFVLISIILNMNEWHIFLAAHIFTIQALLSHLDYDVPNTWITRSLRKVFVLSDSHRFHHSPENPNTNFGFLFSFWDYLFKTSTATK